MALDGVADGLRGILDEAIVRVVATAEMVVASFDPQTMIPRAKDHVANDLLRAIERLEQIDQRERGEMTDVVVGRQACLTTSVQSDDLTAHLHRVRMERLNQTGASDQLGSRVLKEEALAKEAHVESVADGVLARIVDSIHEENDLKAAVQGTVVFHETANHPRVETIAEVRVAERFEANRTSIRRLTTCTAQRAHTLSIVEIQRLNLAVTDSIVVEGAADRSVAGADNSTLS